MHCQTSPGGRARTLASLVELVAALDRRVPRAERSSERQIAAESSALRAEAKRRIAQMLHGAAARTRELELSGDVMTDDGAPPPEEE